MSEIRGDIVTGNNVIIAVERGKRPHDYQQKKEEKKGGFCPFCYGHEKETPPEVAAIRDVEHPEHDTPGWQIRVVPNKFAALQPELKLEVKKAGIYTCLSGKGRAEVIIESPIHDSTLGSHNRKHLENLIRMILQRYIILTQEKDIKYVQVFKNFGSVAGASLGHPHWQIISTPLVPSVQLNELKGAGDYFKKNGECGYCRMIEEEIRQGIRIVEENNGFVAFCPYASRYPFETWLLPKEHQISFSQIRGEKIKELGEILQKIIRKLELGFNYPPYNLILHTSPVDGGEWDCYHWHLEILPRLTITAGFELGTGYFINPTPPEIAAKSLREIPV